MKHTSNFHSQSTMELAQGKNMPRVYTPSTGPPTIPKRPSAACSSGPISDTGYVSAVMNRPNPQADKVKEYWCTNKYCILVNTNRLFKWPNVFGYFYSCVVISLLVKYYLPLADINKVIKVLRIKSAVNLHGLQRRNRKNAKTQWYFAIECVYLDCASRWNPLQIHCRFYL